MSTRILVVDDERPIAEILKYNLEKEGYEVILAYDGEEALALLEQGEPDLVLLDIMLPKKDGFAVCREIRAHKEIPIIMLTAKESEADKVRGLELGADDYVTKPFGAREVIARVKAALRRARSPSTAGGRKQLRHGDLLVDPETMMVFNRSRPVELTPKEFSLLLVLIRRPGRIFNRQQLLNQVWGYDYFGDERTVDVTIRRLREKLESDPAAPEYIRTKRGVGYFFRQR